MMINRCARLTLELLLLTLAISQSACQDNDLSCVERADCFRDQACYQGRCTPLDELPTDQDGDMRASPDLLTAPDASRDLPSDPACLMPVDACQEDPQEKQSTFAFEVQPQGSRAVGCVGFSDAEIVGLPATMFSGRLCELDSSGDWYSIEYMRCRNVNYRVTMTLTIKTPCPQELIEVVFNADCGADAPCTLEQPAPNIYKHTSTFSAISSQRPSNTIPLKIRAKRPGLRLDYELVVEATQLP